MTNKDEDGDEKGKEASMIHNNYISIIIVN